MYSYTPDNAVMYVEKYVTDRLLFVGYENWFIFYGLIQLHLHF
jgi:hypothetical protein